LPQQREQDSTIIKENKYIENNKTKQNKNAYIHNKSGNVDVKINVKIIYI